MQYTAKIIGKLPSLNDYILACRANRYAGAELKKNTESMIALYIMQLPRITKPVFIDFHWIEENRRRDLDNCSFAKKFVLDALVKWHKLENDDQRHVRGFQDTFEIGKPGGVEITITEIEEG